MDEEWRHLSVLNAVKSKSTAFPNVPFYRNAYRFGTDRRSSSAPVCELGHLPPGGRYCAALILTNTNLSGSCIKPICTVCIWPSPSPVEVGTRRGGLLVQHPVAYAQLVDHVAVVSGATAQLFADVGHVHLELLHASVVQAAPDGADNGGVGHDLSGVEAQ